MSVEKDFAHKKTLKVKPEVIYKAVKKSLLAKKAAVYLLKRYSSLTNKSIGSMFGISYLAVSKINKDIQIIMDHLTFQGLTRIYANYPNYQITQQVSNVYRDFVEFAEKNKKIKAGLRKLDCILKV